MKTAYLLVAALLLAGCEAGGMSGDYGGPKCIYNKISFKSGGKMTVAFMGIEMPGEYKVDGNKVMIRSADGRGLVFTRDGDTLHGGIAGQCVKL